MTKKYLLAGVLIFSFLLTACNMQYRAPEVAVTPSPTGPFGNQASGATAMAALLTQGASQSTPLPGTQTAAALTGTVVSNGTAITPVTQITFTSTPQIGGLTVVATTPAAVCTPSACAVGQTLVCPGGNCAGGCGMVCAVVTSTFTALPQGAVPSTWTLHNGEFPYCIARRFNLDPEYLLNYPGNEWTYGAPYSAGEVLFIPPASDARRGPFPGDRALRSHAAGTTYTVTGNNDTNLYAVACIFGDVNPDLLAQLNGLSLSSVLNVGQVIKIQ